jgi:ectoine hydroxylase-related dioxygenase (phytanoyl-CoA dioxygenase family)
MRDPQDQDAYFAHDQAATHGSTAGQHERVPKEVTDGDVEALLRDGFLILPDVLSPEELQRIREASDAHLGPYGRNSLEGSRTQRLYSVLRKTQAANRLVEHPRILCIIDRLLLPNYLLSMFQIIRIHPGEKQQVLHHDDAFYPLARPRPPVSVASILAVDDFTEENGATVYVPGSHRWADQRPGGDSPTVSIVMPAGSAVVFLGTLWHGGGANRSSASRLAVTAQYCEPWARTQENMFLAVDRDSVAGLSENLIRMLGYSIHAPFMGNVDGMSPKRSLS